MGIKLNKFQPLKFIFLFVISLLSGCSITPPKEYVGIWSNGVTVLKIEESGQLHYSSKSRSSSFPIEKINETEISAFPAFIFTLPIEGAPNFSEEGSEFLIVDGETLYKYNINKEGIYKDISTDITRPTDEECRLNNRAKSTKMRWAIKA